MALIKKADPNNTDTIVLGKDPYIDSLYGCFRFDNPKAERFTTERYVEVIFKSGKKIKVVVPEKIKIVLDDKVKVALSKSFTLWPITKHKDTMKLLTMRAGWNQNDRDIERLVSYDPDGSFVGKIKGIPVASCSVLPIGLNHTWIGMILVHPELRRQGIANIMMQHCIEYALNKNKIINGLDATPLGNTVYGSVGYIDSYRIWRCFYELSEFADKTYDTNHIKRVTEKDLTELIRYDAECFLAREMIIRKLYKDSAGEAYIYRNDNGTIKGYILGRPGRLRVFVGPFTADDDSIAMHLLTAISSSYHKKGEKTAFIDTPESKFSDPGVYDKKIFDQQKKPSGHRLIKSMNPVRDFTRMYQVVREEDTRNLISKFTEHENIIKTNPFAVRFEKTTYKAIKNYTETLSFMEYEKNVLQIKYYGTTGPEKG